jgi:hypothetical protein
MILAFHIPSRRTVREIVISCTSPESSGASPDGTLGFLLGAVVLGLLAAGLLPFGPHALNNVVGVTLVAALLSFVPEMIWKKYSD